MRKVGVNPEYKEKVRYIARGSAGVMHVLKKRRSEWAVTHE
jgi:hypothetical protein